MNKIQRKFIKLVILDLQLKSQHLMMYWVLIHTWRLRFLEDNNIQQKLMYGRWE